MLLVDLCSVQVFPFPGSLVALGNPRNLLASFIDTAVYIKQFRNLRLRIRMATSKCIVLKFSGSTTVT